MGLLLLDLQRHTPSVLYCSTLALAVSVQSSSCCFWVQHLGLALQVCVTDQGVSWGVCKMSTGISQWFEERGRTGILWQGMVSVDWAMPGKGAQVPREQEHEGRGLFWGNREGVRAQKVRGACNRGKEV